MSSAGTLSPVCHKLGEKPEAPEDHTGNNWQLQPCRQGPAQQLGPGRTQLTLRSSAPLFLSLLRQLLPLGHLCRLSVGGAGEAGGPRHLADVTGLAGVCAIWPLSHTHHPRKTETQSHTAEALQATATPITQDPGQPPQPSQLLPRSFPEFSRCLWV